MIGYPHFYRRLLSVYPPSSGIVTLSLHDALPISRLPERPGRPLGRNREPGAGPLGLAARDRKSTRLNSSHRTISYAVFCLKKKIIGRKTLSNRLNQIENHR